MRVEELREELLTNIKVLDETTWEGRAKKPIIMRWLDNFEESDQIRALYLLSQFMYFGNLQMRNLLKALYRDIFKYRKIMEIRKANSDTTDLGKIRSHYDDALKRTRFLAIGNPSESGQHLLYFFRQENKLSKRLFINSHEIFDRSSSPVKLKYPNVDEYVFIDDFCGSGTQASGYSDTVLKELKSINDKITTSYIMLFGTSDGIDNVRKNTDFDKVEAVFELDETFRCFDENSRYFTNCPESINKELCEQMSAKHGFELMKSIWALEGVTQPQLDEISERDRHGYKDNQLMIGFFHNTPDNSLPIFWYDEKNLNWFPIFKRYNKKYGF